MDEIERDHLRLIPGVFTFESKQEKGSWQPGAGLEVLILQARPDVTPLASDGLAVGLTFLW